MSRERLSKLIHYLESNAKAIKPTFDMRHYGTCVICKMISLHAGIIFAT